MTLADLKAAREEREREGDLEGLRRRVRELEAQSANLHRGFHERERRLVGEVEVRRRTRRARGSE